VQTEHVIPRSLLGPAPSTEAWPVVLDVHASCERVAKQVPDGFVVLLQQMNTEPVERWPARHLLDASPIRAKLTAEPTSGIVVPTFTGAGELIGAVQRWVRGLHAALYGEYLGGIVLALPPVPDFHSSGAIGVGDWDALGGDAIARTAVSVGEDRWHGVVAWGGTLRYYCTWSHIPALNPPWLCSWTLTHPRVLDWSETVIRPGRPWHGCYQTLEAPARIFGSVPT
jgi:hypothetical protein